MGRWSYITLKGKNKAITSNFNFYHPYCGKSPGSAYSHLLVYMVENKADLPKTNCLRQLFGIDLKLAIEEKMDLGHPILVMGNFISEYKELTSWMLELGL